MIEINNLTKKIGENKILSDISFSVKQGEILGFLGPNGAGKTTTMKIITSFWQPDSGSVKIDGLDVSKDSLKTREKIGYLPETVPLYEDMKVHEYLKFVAEMRNIKKEKIKDRIKEVAESCGLSSVMDKTIDQLSKGYKQRVGLAQAIIHNPDVLILDEPTTGLDPNQVSEIRRLIKEIGREKTVIFSTHILGEVEATCDRVVIINNGQITGEGSPEDLAKKADPREVYYVKIRGDKESVLRKLNDMIEVEFVAEKDKEDEHTFGYEIRPYAGKDIRENLFKTISATDNWSILEINKLKASLEDIFRELTK
ncbi:ATP-binding cassette domain-containing protein [Candidatus Falkowbacteria bacterium]|nr:ATP-binding cassette domain-containing protein [Candidatus Falkowbacteria bacterium]